MVWECTACRPPVVFHSGPALKKHRKSKHRFHELEPAAPCTEAGNDVPAAAPSAADDTDRAAQAAEAAGAAGFAGHYSGSEADAGEFYGHLDGDEEQLAGEGSYVLMTADGLEALRLQMQEDAYNVDLEVVLYMNRHNASASQMQDLLDILRKCKERPALLDKMQLETVEECRVVATELIEVNAGGWLEAEFTHDLLSAPLKLHYRDSAQWLSRQYGLKKYKGRFATRAAVKKNAVGERVYCAPEDCDAWLGLQEAHGSGDIAAIQVFSDKTAVNFKGLSVWPCRFGLLNAALKVRERELMAYFPDVKESHLKQTVSRERLSQLRREVFHWGQGMIFGPLKPLSHTGIQLSDPYGMQHLVYPELLVFVCDHPEAMLISNNMNSAKTKLPCDQCKCPCDQLHDVSKQHPLRLQSEQEQNFQRIVSGSLRPADVSQHPVKCGHWGFFGGKTKFHAFTGNDFMHNEELGVYLKIIKGLTIYAAHYGKTAGAFVDQLNSRLRAVPRCSDFPNPAAGSGVYFVTNDKGYEGFTQGKEHRVVIQLLPHVLNGILGNRCAEGNKLLVELAAMYALLYAAMSGRQTKMGFTEGDLQGVDRDLLRFMAKLQEYSDVCQSTQPADASKVVNLQTMKVHRASERTRVIRLAGMPEEISTAPFETAHAPVKADYRLKFNALGELPNEGRLPVDAPPRLAMARRATNKQSSRGQYLVQMVQRDDRRRALNEVEQVLGQAQRHVSRRRYCPAYDRANNPTAPCNTLQRTAKALSLARLELERSEVDLEQLPMASGAAERNASDLVQSQPELMGLPFLLKQYSDAAGINLGPQADLLSRNVYAVNGGVVLCPTYGDPDTVTPQHVRATPDFHRAPYFDSVTIQWEDDDGTHDDHAQLRLLFRMADADGVQRELALIRWYEDVTAIEPDMLSGFGAAHLRWALSPSSHRQALAVIRPRGYYDIVELQSIVGRAYIVQDHAKADRFHLSPFKWS